MSNASTIPGNASSFLDTRQLGQLRGQASKDPAKAVRATAEQFESHFIQQMITAMRKTVEKSDLVDSDKMDTYQDMMDKELAASLTKRGGIGLADVLERQLTQGAGTSTAAALSQHPGINKGMALKRAAQALPLPTRLVLPMALPAAQGALPLSPAPGMQPMPLSTRDRNAIADPAAQAGAVVPAPAAPAAERP